MVIHSAAGKEAKGLNAPEPLVWSFYVRAMFFDFVLITTIII